MKSLFIKSQWHYDKKSFWLYIPLTFISAFSQQPGTQVCSQELLQSQSWLPVFRPPSPCAVFPYEASRMARTPVFESWAVRLRVRWVVGSHKYLKYFQDSAKAWHLGSRKFVTCTNLFSTLSVRELKTSIKSDNFLPLSFLRHRLATSCCVFLVSWRMGYKKQTTHWTKGCQIRG